MYSSNIDQRFLVKLLFKNKNIFIKKSKGILSPEAIDYAIQTYFSPKKRKFTDAERAERKKQILYQVNLLNYEFDIFQCSFKYMEKDIEQVEQLISESGFTKSRKEKLRFFLLSMIRWSRFIENLSYEHLKALEGIYWDLSIHVANGLTPLPATLMGHWVSCDLPARKSAERFERDIINKLLNVIDRALFMNSYYLDKTGSMYILKKSVTDEDKEIMRAILEHIGYINNSGTKYIDFLKYLIKKDAVELKVQYSTHGKCKYYKINI
jgi:hypothetical protein